MISYIKIYGPPLNKAVKELEKIAVDTPQVCIMDPVLVTSPPSGEAAVGNYFGAQLPVERCNTIISKSGEKLGDYDFFFEWFKTPTQAEINNLITKIDEALTPLGCKYTIVTK